MAVVVLTVVRLEFPVNDFAHSAAPKRQKESL